MIDHYFNQIEQILKTFADISSYQITKKKYNNEQGFITCTITFSNGFQLEITEVVDTSIPNKLKYRYHFMDDADKIIFRYDNAPHHKELTTFPHHKHTGTTVLESPERSLVDVLVEISKLIHNERK